MPSQYVIFQGTLSNLSALPSTGTKGVLAYTTDTEQLYTDTGSGVGIPAAWKLQTSSGTSSGVASVGANSPLSSTGGTNPIISITTPITVAEGGTGATTSSAARTAIGAAVSGVNTDITSLTGLTTPIPVTEGGTGATTSSAARTAIRAAASGANADITSLTGLTTPIPVTEGGTGTATPGLVAGTNVTVTGSFPNQTVSASVTGGPSYGINGFVSVPPSGATVFPNLQTLGSGGWTILGGTAPSGGTNTGSSAVTYNNSSPSITPGGSIALTSNGNGYNTQLFTQHPNSSFPSSSPALLTDVTVDLWFYIPSSSNTPQALEGPDVTLYNGTYQMYPSIQADSASGYWRVWTGSSWLATTYPIGSLLTTTNVWQHLQVRYTFDSPTNSFAYQDLWLNGVPVFQNLNRSYTGSLNSGALSIKTQVQIDNTSSATATTIYYDAINTTAWVANSFIPAATATSATSGSASALPATPAGYLPATVNGTLVKIPYYNP